MAHLGSIDTKNKDYHQRKDDDDDDKMNSAASSPESIPLSAEGNASSFYKKRQARSAMYDKDNKFAKQRRFRKRCLLVFSVICFFVCGCVFIRLWKSSSMLKDSQTTEGTTAVLTFDSWQDVTTKSAAAYRLSMSNGSESLRERENLEKIEAVNVETKNPIHVDGKRKKKRTKSAVLIYKTRSNWSQQSGVYSLPSSTKASTRWDVNAPPVRLPDGVNLKSRNKRKEGEYSVKQRRGPGSSTEGGGRGEGDLALIQKANSNEAPNTPGVPLHASEALQCRESVINFVINATDGKDECDGLIKAFDKTCSNDETDTHDSRRRRQLENRRQPPSPSRHRKRRLWDKLHVPYAIRLRALAYRTSRTLERSAQCLFRMLGSAEERSPFFFAEDEVFKAWDVAQYFVANSLDGLIQSVARSSMYKEQCLLYEREEDEKRGRQMRQLEEKLEEEVSHELPPLVTDKAKGPPSSTALQLPIKSQQHVSEKTANDALLLQQGEKIIKAANESLVAKEEAAKSKKSISATSDAVSAVLNDPSSVEARTCCASILNVYHELCSSDVEEQVSDKRLFFLVFIMACCGMVKSLIRHFRILWLPEAAGCIIVGGKCNIRDVL